MKWCYENIILLEDESISKEDIESKLWKKCIYAVIEQFRMKLKHYGKIVKSHDVEHTYDQRILHASKEMKNIGNEFRKFLETSSGFYNNLLLKYKQIHSLSFHNPIFYSIVTEDSYSKNLTCYKIMIRLGDLSRYHKDIPGSNRSDWSIAWTYYQDAQRLLPHYGSAYNQLSVLSTYDDNKLQALYYACRAISIENPFSSAVDNLRLFFELHKKGKGNKKKQNKPSKERVVDSFIPNFILINSYIFEGDYQSYLASPIKLQHVFFQMLNEEDKDSYGVSTPKISMYIFAILIFSINHLRQLEDSNTMRLEALSRTLLMAMEMYKFIIQKFCFESRSDSQSLLSSIFIMSLWIELFDEPMIKLVENALGESKLEELKSLILTLSTKIHVLLTPDNLPSYVSTLLPEEQEILGFLPLEEAFQFLKHTKNFVCLSEENCTDERLLKLKSILRNSQLFKRTQQTKKAMLPTPVSILKDDNQDDSDIEEDSIAPQSIVGSIGSERLYSNISEVKKSNEHMQSLFGHTFSSSHPQRVPSIPPHLLGNDDVDVEDEEDKSRSIWTGWGGS